MSDNQFQHKGSVHFYEKKPKKPNNDAVEWLIIAAVILGVICLMS
jgi:hypothetical protein